MKDFADTIIRALVDYPDDVRLTELDGDKTCILELRCNSKDLGKVIGKSGKTIGAVRTLLSALAARHGRRAMIEVVD
jgi:hypothetical protein